MIYLGKNFKGILIKSERIYMCNKEILMQEADAYFIRNKNVMNEKECSDGMKIFAEFYEVNKNIIKIKDMLEVGCSSGYNLIYMNKKYGIKGFGIEPSKEAVLYGSEIVSNGGSIEVELRQGFADEMPFQDEAFDAVYLGFCLYQVHRSLLFRTLSESDRVLKYGGYCVITDFDTPIRFLRNNAHNAEIFTYKTDYAQYLLPYGYTLVYKKMYTHQSFCFCPDMQERISTQIFYKERLEDWYIKG